MRKGGVVQTSVGKFVLEIEVILDVVALSVVGEVVVGEVVGEELLPPMHESLPPRLPFPHHH